MICHKSHAQEILASDIDGNSTSEYIRKLALDIEQTRTVCERLAKRNEDTQDDIEALKDKLLDVKIHCYVLQFFLIVTIAVVCCLILKQI